MSEFKGTKSCEDLAKENKEILECLVSCRHIVKNNGYTTLLNKIDKLINQQPT